MPKFLNIALASDPQPSLINVEHILRVRPGSPESPATGRDVQCTIYLAVSETGEYVNSGEYIEPITIGVHLSVKEIVRRLATDCLIV